MKATLIILTVIAGIFLWIRYEMKRAVQYPDDYEEDPKPNKSDE